MPQRVICSKCGKEIYRGEDLKPPDEIIEILGGRCPYCGRELSFIPVKIEIKLAQQTLNLQE
ncbi:hypothetical protein J7L06_04360 [Candidatus Bathyarchaeota archaeon]|nr:hypothetical protein [Candidatus Bathyarchaeota archaeon]